MNEMKVEIKTHFENQFSETYWRRPILGDVDFRQISDESKSMLTTPFSETKIKEAVWSCGGSKSPGPNRFNFDFLRKVGNFSIS